ncbi:hypothetical protein [Sphingomonas sp.]|uniref:tetratricopeptide repeat protein n=1 Tax=Sphingomonas sp. TaxID=28214 RepID=UPI001D893A1F|nr:hypothetical protein [Sphingomonas sp.]MBX9795895.1 hypothetical protein [Sphingomonas sp.]
MTRRIGVGVAGALALVVAGSAMAETIRITGNFPAPYREASFLRRISIDRMTGVDGAALGFALERAIGRSGYFTMVVGGAPATASLAGSVTTDVNERRVQQQRNQCTQRDGDKCVKNELVNVTCNERAIDVIADIRIADIRDGRIVYSERKARQDRTTRCPGDGPPPATEGVIRGMVDSIAIETATNITPFTKTYDMRFYESRDGLDKETGARFKDAIRQTQRDPVGGCAAIAALNEAVPQFALAYDAGLCAEASGDFAAALALYQRAASLRPRDTADFDSGAVRARQLIQRAEDDARR